jgi:uncharacterized membrane protein YkvA (DUF1232 family)
MDRSPDPSPDPIPEPDPDSTTVLDRGLRVPNDGYDRFRQLVQRSCERFAGTWGREAADLIMLIPDLLLLFADLARDPRVSRRHKAVAVGVVAYLLSPIDLLPEALLGPLGLADDVALAFMALDLMLNRVDPAVVREHWRGEADLLAVSQAGLKLARRLIPVKLYNRLLRWIENHP